MSGTKTAATAVGAFVWVETMKPVLLRKAWIAGFLGCAAATVVLATLLPSATASSSPSLPVDLLVLISCFGQLAAAVIGWWVCVNKKDDLNMMRSLQQMGSLVGRLKEAEGKLRVALDSMLISGAKMDELDAEIDAAYQEANAQLTVIREEQNKIRESKKAHTLSNVLMKYVNADDRPNFYSHDELESLYRMVRNMTGEPNTDQEMQNHAHLKEKLLSDEMRSKQMKAGDVLDILRHFDVFEMIMSEPENSHDDHDHDHLTAEVETGKV